MLFSTDSMSDIVDLSLLKSRERDQLEAVFKSWSCDVPCNSEYFVQAIQVVALRLDSLVVLQCDIRSMDGDFLRLPEQSGSELILSRALLNFVFVQRDASCKNDIAVLTSLSKTAQ